MEHRYKEMELYFFDGTPFIADAHKHMAVDGSGVIMLLYQRMAMAENYSGPAPQQPLLWHSDSSYLP